MKKNLFLLLFIITIIFLFIGCSEKVNNSTAEITKDNSVSVDKQVPYTEDDKPNENDKSNEVSESNAEDDIKNNIEDKDSFNETNMQVYLVIMMIYSHIILVITI